MDAVTRKRIDAFDRCEQWFNDNSAGVNTIGKLKNLALEFKTKLTTLDDWKSASHVEVPPKKKAPPEP